MAAPSDPLPPHATVDVLIVGAGISGIGMAARMARSCPTRSYAIIEQRAQPGGTWDLFRYPGVRSDSDMHTLGFSFAPWMDDDAIAGGNRILAYLRQVMDEHNIQPHIRFATKVVSADFNSAAGLWHVVLEQDGQRSIMHAKILYLAAGYYDHDHPHDPLAPDAARFNGPVIHPQFWPEKLDYKGKRIIVIGSGATSVTLVPALAAGGAGHVTMLQRTPTWMVSLPAHDRLARVARKFLPERTAARLVRAKNVRLQDFVFKLSRRAPDFAAWLLSRATKKELGQHYDPAHFLPPYPPWDQRLCVMPDGDFFAALKRRDASIVTGQIAAITPNGVELGDGRHVPADILVTATGLKLAMAGGIKVSLDGRRISWRKHFYYRGCMFSNVPNLFVAFGYLNASWTLRTELSAQFACDVLNMMAARNMAIVHPYLPDDHGLVEDDVFTFSSGYLQRARPLMPKSASVLPWRLNQDYLQDRRDFRKRPVDDGILRFEPASSGAKPHWQADKNSPIVTG